MLSGVLLPSHYLDKEEYIAEFEALADSAGGLAIERQFQHRPKFDPAYAIGKGKAQEILGICLERKIQAVLFIHDLTPTQQKNLDDLLPLGVVDRTALILDIFAQRAKTKEGKLQVELAQLRYRLPRLAGKQKLLNLYGESRALSRLGGGIGTRGPGEQKLETDRRRILQRIDKLSREMKRIKKHRAVMAQGRKDRRIPVAALVGYTNAGKTTLLNALAGADAFTANQYFATLDPLARSVYLSDRKTVLISDTVGFIQDFPPQLIAAFRATLEELAEADILLHVVDASHRHLYRQMEAVHETLNELGLEDKPLLLVMNKMDQVTDDGERKELKMSFPQASFISAAKGFGLRDLKEKIAREIRQHG